MSAVSVSKNNVRIVTAMLSLVVGILFAYLLFKVIFGNWVFNPESVYMLVGCLGVIFGSLGVIYFGALAVRAILELREDFGYSSRPERSSSHLVLVILVLAFVSLSTLTLAVASSPEIDSVSSVEPVMITDCPVELKKTTDANGVESLLCVVTP
jgi:hypothetical protein